MKEKLHVFQLDHPLTVARRKVIERLIETNKHRTSWKVNYEWDEEEKVLHLQANSIKAALLFHPKSLEVYVEIPFFLRMMVTDKIRDQVLAGIQRVLIECGMINSPDKLKKKKASTSKKAG